MAEVGPTGKHPDGKLNPDDKGELKFAIYVLKGNVVLDFGKPLSWVGVPPQTAREIAAALSKAADHVEPPKSA